MEKNGGKDVNGLSFDRLRMIKKVMRGEGCRLESGKGIKE
jgi:hypothetical protein